MRWRLSITQLRIVLIVGNLALAAGVLGYAALSYYGLKDQEHTQPPIDLRKLGQIIADAPPQTTRTSEQLIPAASYLMPQRQAVLPEVTTPSEVTPPEDEPTVAAGQEYPLGPLGEGDEPWEYVTYIFYGFPENAFVVLKKKTEGAANAPRPTTRTTAFTRGRVVTSSSRGGRPVVRPGQARQSDRVSFFVSERRFTDEELGIDILIHSADPEKLVYSEFTNPQQMFALPYVVPEGILSKPEGPLLAKEEPTPDDGSAPEKKKYFFEFEEDYDAMVNAEYEAMLKGAGAGPAIQSIGATEGAEGTGQGGAGPAEGGAAGASAGGTPNVSRRPPTAEERRQLDAVLKSDRMSPEDRARLEGALRGGPPRSSGGGPTRSSFGGRGRITPGGRQTPRQEGEGEE